MKTNGIVYYTSKESIGKMLLSVLIIHYAFVVFLAG